MHWSSVCNHVRLKLPPEVAEACDERRCRLLVSVGGKLLVPGDDADDAYSGCVDFDVRWAKCKDESDEVLLNISPRHFNPDRPLQVVAFDPEVGFRTFVWQGRKLVDSSCAYDREAMPTFTHVWRDVDAGCVRTLEGDEWR